MTALPISKPMLALLLVTLGAAVVTSLAPAPNPHAVAEELLPTRVPPDSAETLSGADNASATDTALFLRPKTRVEKTSRHNDAANAFGQSAPPTPPTPPILPPPPAPMIVEAPPAPAASFVYLGRLLQEDTAYIFLQDGEDAIAVVPGSPINSQWQLEQANESELVLRHKPLDQTSTIRIAP